MRNQRSPKDLIQFSLLESLIEKNLTAEKIMLDLRLVDSGFFPQLIEVIGLHDAIDTNLRVLHFAVSSLSDGDGVTAHMPAESWAKLRHFLRSAIGVAEWLRTEYTAGNPDAIDFMGMWLTVKSDYADINPELSVSDASLDDFGFISVLRVCWLYWNKSTFARIA